jgi:hypothetical protein
MFYTAQIEEDIEGTAIYTGKKQEVVNIMKLTINKATNNARQIFAQVVGLISTKVLMVVCN